MTTALRPPPRTPGVEQLRDAILGAVARRAPLRIAGAGTWLDANHPVAAADTLSTRSLSGILEYVPGDLTITVGSGATLAGIARVAAEAGQWLTLDPWGDEEGTIGATVATASAGPLSHGFGTPRDVVLGLEFITGAGTLVRAGGRVVKNVAGYDLSRLLTGSWGTLGVITEITLRLRALPEVERTLAISPSDDGREIGELRRRLAALPFTTFAAELLNGALARTLGLHDRTVLLLRIGGNAAAVDAQRSALASFGDVGECPADVWRALRRAEPAGAPVFRLSQLPSRLDETWRAASTLGELLPGTFVHATLGRGIVRCIVPPHERDGDALRAALARPFDGTRIFERLPAGLWALVGDAAAADRLSLGIRRAYDPHRLLNPGILGEPKP